MKSIAIKTLGTFAGLVAMFGLALTFVVSQPKDTSVAPKPTAQSLVRLPAVGATTPPATIHAQGAIRCENGDYTMINDTAHQSYGIAYVTETTTYIRVTYTTPMTLVGSFQVTSDETYASYKVVGGASVGLSYADIKIYKDGVLQNPANTCYPYSNFWVTAWEG